MKNFSILTFFCLCQIALFSQSCGDYSVKLSKTEMFCDGWEGNSIAIKINNVIVYPDVTLTQGQNSYDFFFPVNTDDVVSVLFKRNGSYADCCKYQIFDSNNNLLETRDGDGTGSNGVY